MIESGGDPHFAQESFGTQSGRELRTQDLDRDTAIELQVLGEVDRRHPAMPQLALDRVAFGERSFQAGELVGLSGHCARLQAMPM
jgi:hypothetical protein